MKKIIFMFIILFSIQLSLDAAVTNFTQHDLTGTSVTATTQATVKGFQLTWDLNTEYDIFSYRVYYSVGDLSNFISYGTVIHPTNIWINNLNIIRYKTYYWTLTAIDTSGNESDHSTIVATEIINAKPKFINHTIKL